MSLSLSWDCNSGQEPAPALSKFTAWGEDGEHTGTQINGAVGLASVVRETGQWPTTWPEGVWEDFLEKVMSQISFKVEKSQPSAGRGEKRTPGSRASMEASVFRVESNSSHATCEMGPEGQGQQIEVSDQLWLLQGEGSLEASEEGAAGSCSPFQPHWAFWRRPFSLPTPLPLLFPFAGYALPMAALKDMDGWSPPPNKRCVLSQVRGAIPHPVARTAAGSSGHHASFTPPLSPGVPAQGPQARSPRQHHEPRAEPTAG